MWQHTAASILPASPGALGLATATSTVLGVHLYHEDRAQFDTYPCLSNHLHYIVTGGLSAAGELALRWMMTNSAVSGGSAGATFWRRCCGGSGTAATNAGASAISGCPNQQFTSPDLGSSPGCPWILPQSRHQVYFHLHYILAAVPRVHDLHTASMERGCLS